MRNIKIISLLLTCSLSLHAKKAQQTIEIPWRPNFKALPKQCKIKKISKSPYIISIENFFTDEETEHLKQTAQPLLKRSTVVETTNREATSSNRTSSSAYLHMMQSEMMTVIRKRAAAFVNTDMNNVEFLQVVHYKDGQEYKPHWDYFLRELPTAKDVIGAAGQRIATFFVYLNDVKQGVGGETFFPKVSNGLKITPKKNMAVFWYNVHPNGLEDDRTLHGGLPINEGEKWATNIWIRDPRLANPPVVQK